MLSDLKTLKILLVCCLIEIAAKKVSLADVGVVGGLSDGSDERERGAPTSFYMGRAMGTGSGLGKTGFPTQETFSGDDFFSNLNGQKHQFGSFQK